MNPSDWRFRFVDGKNKEQRDGENGEQMRSEKGKFTKWGFYMGDKPHTLTLPICQEGHHPTGFITQIPTPLNLLMGLGFCVKHPL